MTTIKSMSEMPQVTFSDQDIMSGQFSALLARLATENGPIFKLQDHWQVASNKEVVFMVGPEANRFVLHTHRDHFSHDQGWTPLIGDTMGQGLLNMDDPMHSRHRR